MFGYVNLPIKEICNHFSSGGTPNKAHSEYYDGGAIPWLRTQEVNFNKIYATENFITEAGLANSSAKWIPPHCVIVCISGASAGRSAINMIPLTTNQHCCNLEINPTLADYKYIFYCLSQNYEVLQSLGQGARGDLNAQLITSLVIPIPSLKVQRYIVSILERFDTLCHDISSGLPAEIEARQKQYEYYRDKLLDFKEKKG